MKKFLASVQFKIVLIGLFAVIIATSVLLSISMLGDVQRPTNNPATQTLPSSTHASTEIVTDTMITIPLSSDAAEDDSEIVDGQSFSATLILWIDGEKVLQTPAQIVEWKKNLYACKTQAEYESYIANVFCFNNGTEGIEMLRFSWYWDEFEDDYSDEQMVILKSGSKVQKRIPNVIGMDAQSAYNKLISLGFVASFCYANDANSTSAVGICYQMDPPAGSMQTVSESFGVYIQAPIELRYTRYVWDPDDTDFDILAYVANLRKNGQYLIDMPNLIGMTEAEARAKLASVGFKNVSSNYAIVSSSIAPGICYKQPFTYDFPILNTALVTLYIQGDGLTIQVPNLVGMPVEKAMEVLYQYSIGIQTINVNEPENPIAAGCCLRQSFNEFVISPMNYITLYIQDPTIPAETTSTTPPTDTTPTTETAAPTETTPTA